MNKAISLFSSLAAILLLSGMTLSNPPSPRTFTPTVQGRPSTTSSSLNAKCSQVTVDCRNHRISIRGASLSPQDAVIDCGANGKTINGTGTIGGRHVGRLVKNGVRIEGILGMGDTGGGKVFHTPFWRRPPMPRGEDGSKGCVRTSPNVLRILKSCKGAQLTITGATTRRYGSPRRRNSKGVK